MVKTRRLRYFAIFAVVQLLCTLFAVTGFAQTRPEDPNNLPPGEWQFGAFFAGGFAPFYSVHSAALSYDLSLDFYNAGLQGGVMLGKAHGPGLLRGRPEAVLEVVPYWKASYPKQTVIVQFKNPLNSETTFIKGSFVEYGATITPLLFRWNFVNRKHKSIMPWTQIGGGLLWTNHKFPLMGGSTSVINFTPQGGIGASLFVRQHQSIDFAIKAVHISSAGLGDNNPGVNATLQFSAGYSWWK